MRSVISFNGSRDPFFSLSILHTWILLFDFRGIDLEVSRAVIEDVLASSPKPEKYTNGEIFTQS